MRPVDVDFCVRPNWPAVLAAGLATVCLSLGAWLLADARQVTEEARRLDAERRSLAIWLDATVSGPAGATMAFRPRDAELVLRVAAFDWTGLFEAMHSARTPGVRLLVLEVVPSEGLVRVEIEAARPQDALAHVAALNERDAAWRWRLSRLQSAPGRTGEAVTAGFEWWPAPSVAPGQR